LIFSVLLPVLVAFSGNFNNLFGSGGPISGDVRVALQDPLDALPLVGEHACPNTAEAL
jgi:hypothetical protein